MINEVIDGLDIAVTICDENWTITYMNEKSQATFSNYGGGDLIGKDLLACHSEKSCVKLREMKAAKETNVYTISKQGKKKLIYQAPYSLPGDVVGFIELSIELPNEMVHRSRD